MSDMMNSLLALTVLTVVAVLLRVIGFMLAERLPDDNTWNRMLALAPGNLFVAFGTVGILTGGVSVAAGVVCAIGAAMRWRHSELTPILAGGSGVVIAEWFLG